MTLWNGTNLMDGMEVFEEFAGNAGKQLTSVGLMYRIEIQF
jgi:hypothetical protein